MDRKDSDSFASKLDKTFAKFLRKHSLNLPQLPQDAAQSLDSGQLQPEDIGQSRAMGWHGWSLEEDPGAEGEEGGGEEGNVREQLQQLHILTEELRLSD